MVEFLGLSGHITFDTNGLRSQFSLDLLELQQNGLQTVGTWNSVDRLVLDRDEKVDGSSSGGNPMAKLLLKAANLDLEADVFLLLNFPVVPPIKTSSAVGSNIQ